MPTALAAQPLSLSLPRVPLAPLEQIGHFPASDFPPEWVSQEPALTSRRRLQDGSTCAPVWISSATPPAFRKREPTLASTFAFARAMRGLIGSPSADIFGSALKWSWATTTALWRLQSSPQAAR